MSFEISLVTGSVLAVLSLVAIMTALIDGRRPRVAAIVVVIAGGLLVWAVMNAPSGFQLSDIPHAFISVIAVILN